MSKVAHSESRELYVTEALRKGVDLTELGSWLALHQVVRCVTRFKYLGGVSTRIRQQKKVVVGRP